MQSYGIYKERCKRLKGIGLINGSENDYAAYNTYSYFDDILTYQDFRKCKNFSSNRSKKRKRCNDKYFKIEILAKLTRAKMVFGTITFNDDFLLESYDTQKKRIQTYLKKYFFYVIKNIDYGSKTERKHYHYIGLTFNDLFLNGKKSKKLRPMYNFKNDWWASTGRKKKPYGFAPNMEIIPYNMEDKKRLANYLVKLNNHSNKISVKKSRLSILKNEKYLKKYCVFSDCIL